MVIGITGGTGCGKSTVSKQMSEEEYTEFANIVIYNDGTLEDLQDSVDELIKKI